MEATKRRPKVAIIYKSLPQYRRKFFELLRERLDNFGIELLLIYGQAGKVDATKKDTVEIAWARKINNKIYKVGRRELYWQPCLHLLKDVDLVIVEQASKLLINYVLLMKHLIGKQKLAFWGHGKNFQQTQASSIGELIKKTMSRKVHWWFAYNGLSAEVVKSLNFPEEKITIVQNSIDTRSLIEERTRINLDTVSEIKKELNIKGDNVCLYAGGMYAEKRLQFLINSCHLIKKAVPDFEMIFIGAGPDDHIIKAAAKKHEWIHYVGPKFDEQKVPYFVLSKLFLMPGLVGLAVLDSFALEVPLVTTNINYHSPEIEYLKNGINGIIVEEAEKAEAYADTVIHLLRNDVLRQKLIEGSRQSAQLYTVEQMADRFALGVKRALEVNK